MRLMIGWYTDGIMRRPTPPVSGVRAPVVSISRCRLFDFYAPQQLSFVKESKPIYS